MKFKIVNIICVIVLICLSVICFVNDSSFLYLLIPFFIWISLTIFGAYEIRFNYFLLYYIIFKYLIIKYNLKTPGRDGYQEITVFKNSEKFMDYLTN